MPVNDASIIALEADWTERLSALEASALVVLTDTNTTVHCLPRFREVYLKNQHFIHLETPAGETHKTLAQAPYLWSALMKHQVDRKAILICLGGGVVSDLGGFVASTYKRGMRTLCVPTTHLSMCDAAIGGKTGVNFEQVKNQIGTFHMPKAILIDPAFLTTLPQRELASGFAETIKHALIADEQLWERLQQSDWDTLALDRKTIFDSAHVKERIASQDPHDRGIRQALNFGHTIGHALESASHATTSLLLHGEAIAVGMVAETWLSMQCAQLPEYLYLEISNYVLTHYRNIMGDLPSVDTCIQHMRQDKKNIGGQITCSLIANIGVPVTGVQVSEPLLTESIATATRLFRS